MISKSLSFLQNELNRDLLGRIPAEEDWVVVAPIFYSNKDRPAETNNKVILSVVNIEQEPDAGNKSSNYRPTLRPMTGDLSTLHINLSILVSVNFPDSYEKALRLLSLALYFFESKPFFTPQNSPAFPKGMEKLAVKWRDMDLSDMHSLWAAQGGHYQPSFVYKLRLLTADDAWMGTERPLIRNDADQSGST